ncbi:Alpha/Beta hydrolase fold [Phytophthora cactorum]|nr:Alpha/Beta hydrolase fold [Phytophthora cactorum]
MPTAGMSGYASVRIATVSSVSAMVSIKNDTNSSVVFTVPPPAPKAVPSSLFTPCRMGTCTNLPSMRSAGPTSVRKSPSTIGRSTKASRPEPDAGSPALKKNATEYSPECYGYGSDQWVLDNIISEDCLTINVVRPSNVSEGDTLPVGVWVYGGGFIQGGARDPRYNLSYIIKEAVAAGKPIIGVSFNYRLQALVSCRALPCTRLPWQPRAEGPVSGLALGAGERCGFRWRRQQGHDLR